MPNFKDLGNPIQTSQVPPTGAIPKTIKAKDGIYLEVASRAMQGLLANPAVLAAMPLDSSAEEIIETTAIMSCQYANALIEEANKRIVGCQGDTFLQ